MHVAGVPACRACRGSHAIMELEIGHSALCTDFGGKFRVHTEPYICFTDCAQSMLHNPALTPNALMQ